jgi:biopolymer transport protein ExbD
MGMQVGGPRGAVKSDINVVPLCDVMLVLLIIVMIVAPMLHQGVPVSLPLAAHGTPKPDTREQTVVHVNAQGQVYLGTREVHTSELGRSVSELQAGQAAPETIIKADEDAEYSAVMAVMDALRDAGIEDIGLITSEARSAAAGGE